MSIAMSTERASSPTPSERKRQDAEDRKREEEEQSKLPYKWTQTLNEADVNVPIPGNLKARDLVVELKKTHLKVQVKGQDPIIDVCLLEHISTPNVLIQGLPARVLEAIADNLHRATFHTPFKPMILPGHYQLRQMVQRRS